MTDARRKDARAAYDAVPHPYHLFEHIYAVCDAMLAYDAAHAQRYEIRSALAAAGKALMGETDG